LCGTSRIHDFSSNLEEKKIANVFLVAGRRYGCKLLMDGPLSCCSVGVAELQATKAGEEMNLLEGLHRAMVFLLLLTFLSITKSPSA
jgi:hypothetical protein